MNPLDSFASSLIGHPAWGAKQGYGSFLTIEFGEPRLLVKEWHSEKRGFCRQAYVEGQWHIWIYCCEWRVSAHNQQIAWSEDARDDIARATGILDGQKLTKISVSPIDGRSTFEFDLGGLLETRPSGNDQTTEQWFIYGPDAVFGYRADGQYSIQPANTPSEIERWQLFT